MRATRWGMLFAFWLFRSELDCFSSKPAGQCGGFVMSALDAISVFPVLYVAVRAICWGTLFAFSQFSSISELDCFSSKPAGQCGSFVMSALDAISVFPVLYVAVRAICWGMLFAFSQFSSIS